MKRYLSIVLMSSLLPLGAMAQDDPAAMTPAIDSPVVGEAAASEAVAMTVVEETKTVVEKARPFLDNVDWQLFGSGYYMFNAHRVSGAYNSAGYPYTQNHGFGLNFVGADASYAEDNWGLTINLRYGTGAPLLSPLSPLKQGYISWMPSDKLTLDMGFFDTIYGAEVADEWQNVNYSRGALYFLRQPFNHLGLRLGYAVSDKVGLTFIATNGGVYGGSVIDGDQVPAFGWQVSLAPSDDFALFIGGNHAPNGANGNKDWEHLLDIVATYNINDFALVLNADFTISPKGPTTGSEFEVLYGLSLAGIYAINEKWSAGARAEYLGGNGDSGSPDLVTGTLTVRYSPIEHLIFSLEPRVEYSDVNAYFSRNPPTSTSIMPDKKIAFNIILGATAKIGK